jgi:hypothetical protein
MTYLCKSGFLITLEAFKAVNPLPFTVNVPDVILDAFNAFKLDPEPKKLVADKVLDVLFQVKFAPCNIDVFVFPIYI